MFSNYEFTKLQLSDGFTCNATIFLCLIILSFATYKQSKITASSLFYEHIKGLAIICVVVGHVWSHVASLKTYPILGDYAVSLFLFLSGYGLSNSVFNNGLVYSDFINKRIQKVFFPYWIITVVWLLLDHVLLDRTYPFFEILITFAGINITAHSKHLDYVRWYITLLLFWYISFLSLYKFATVRLVPWLLLIIGFCLFLFRLLSLFPFGVGFQLFAFPFGCLCAAYGDFFKAYLNKPLYSKSILFNILLLFLISFFVTLNHLEILSFSRISMHSLLTINDLCFLLLICRLSYFASINKFESSFLVFCGKYSYEIYLIHCPFLVKYNPFFSRSITSIFIADFFVYFVSILLLSFLFARFVSYTREKVFI